MEQIIDKKLRAFKTRYHQNNLIRGLLIFLSTLLVLTILLFSLEYFLRFSSTTRTILFFTSAAVLLIMSFFMIIRHLLHISNIGRSGLDDQTAAREIGKYFPDINDRLLNALQLRTLNAQETSLISASIDQRIKELRPIPFGQAIDFKVNFKYVRILAFITLGVTITSVSLPPIITDGGERIINFRKEFVPEAPFTFVFDAKAEKAFRNEDFSIRLKIDGNILPDRAYLDLGGRLLKLKKENENTYFHEIPNIQNDLRFRFNAAGFDSETFFIKVHTRPNLSSFNVYLDYPDHTRMKSKTLSNVGSFIIPEGTEVTWEIETDETESVEMLIQDPAENIAPYLSDNQFFKLKNRFLQSTKYRIDLKNDVSENKEKLEYKVDVIKDEYPSLRVDYFADTILYEYVIISGNVVDDYGITRLNTTYKIGDGETSDEGIPFNPRQNEHSFYFRVDLDSLGIQENEKFTLYVSATDNDRVNGLKTTKSQAFAFTIPDHNKIESSITEQSNKTEKELDQSIEEAQSINEKLKQLEDRLKSKKAMEWQEEKLLSDILKQRQQIENSIDELRKKFENLQDYEDKFSDRSEQIMEKSKKLQELMNQLLDEETKQMYEELQRLLEEKADLEDIREKLRDLMPSEENMEKELERALELFKRLKLENDLEKVKEKLEKLGEEQSELGEKTEDRKTPWEDIKKEQDEINSDFKEIQEKMDAIKELNQDLEDPEPLENTHQDEQDIERSLDQIQEDIENQKRKSGSQNQKNTGSKLKQLGKKMQNMQMNMQASQSMEDIDNLRHILDNLIKLSFKQEELMQSFREVTQVDPRFVDLSQEQLKLKNDAQVIEDSLMALANRVFQISAFITREVSEVNRNIDQALEELKDRNRSKALSNQQFAMTSINNLALLLDNTLQQMQNMMANATPSPGNDKKGNQELPNLKQLQQQLSEQIKELKDSGLNGRSLSERLAKMAAEQEMLRNQVQKLKEKLEGQMGGEEINDNLGKVLEQMEENEIDLVNKRLTQELVERQEEIMTRLLDAENALREQEFDDERKGETATQYEKNLPKAFEDYLKAKQKEIELLKSVPLELNPFYKKEVNDYFRRLSNPN